MIMHWMQNETEIADIVEVRVRVKVLVASFNKNLIQSNGLLSKLMLF